MRVRPRPRPRFLSRRLALFALSFLTILLLIGLAWWWQTPNPPSATPGAPTQAGQHGFPWRSDQVRPVAFQPEVQDKVARAQRLVSNYNEVQHTYCSYRNATQYPTHSRPLATQSDQMYPNRPVVEDRPMHRSDGAQSQVHIVSSQSRVFLASGETVDFFIRATDADGRPVPMRVTQARAHALVFKGARNLSDVAIDFNGDGAGESGYRASFSPRTNGFANFDGTIRVALDYQVGNDAGSSSFDVIYSPQLPATWGSDITESTEGGSLHFHLHANVLIAGRYVISGRVEDAKGRPVALATFNDVLQVGPQDIRLTVFGKLIQDLKPGFPLALRDVDGYLLRENADPDRALLPRLEGVVHTSQNYAPTTFSNDEWQSEERQRYLAEYGRDVALVRQQLHELDPELERQTVGQGNCQPGL